MGQRSANTKVKRQVAKRFQAIINDRFGTLYQFRKWLEANGAEALAKTVPRWLPPQEKGAPWGDVKIPQGATLMEFCELTGACADYILFGLGAPYRGQDRGAKQLEDDIAVRVARELKEKIAHEVPAHVANAITVELIDGAKVLGLAVDIAAEDVRRELALAAVRQREMMWFTLASGLAARINDDTRWKFVEVMEAQYSTDMPRPSAYELRVLRDIGMANEVAFRELGRSGVISLALMRQTPPLRYREPTETEDSAAPPQQTQPDRDAPTPEDVVNQLLREQAEGMAEASGGPPDEP